MQNFQFLTLLVFIVNSIPCDSNRLGNLIQPKTSKNGQLQNLYYARVPPFLAKLRPEVGEKTEIKHLKEMGRDSNVDKNRIQLKGVKTVLSRNIENFGQTKNVEPSVVENFANSVINMATSTDHKKVDNGINENQLEELNEKDNLGNIEKIAAELISEKKNSTGSEQVASHPRYDKGDSEEIVEENKQNGETQSDEILQRNDCNDGSNRSFSARKETFTRSTIALESLDKSAQLMSFESNMTNSIGDNFAKTFDKNNSQFQTLVSLFPLKEYHPLNSSNLYWSSKKSTTLKVDVPRGKYDEKNNEKKKKIVEEDEEIDEEQKRKKQKKQNKKGDVNEDGDQGKKDRKENDKKVKEEGKDDKTEAEKGQKTDEGKTDGRYERKAYNILFENRQEGNIDELLTPVSITVILLSAIILCCVTNIILCFAICFKFE